MKINIDYDFENLNDSEKYSNYISQLNAFLEDFKNEVITRGLDPDDKVILNYTARIPGTTGQLHSLIFLEWEDTHWSKIEDLFQEMKKPVVSMD